MLKKRLGFVLLELLVVISIVGILAAVGFVSFTGAQKQARDTTRKSDLKQYEILLEAYSGVINGSFPVSSPTVELVSICPSLSASSCPDDPNAPASRYWYQTNIYATKFVIWAALENSSANWVICSNGVSGEAQAEPVNGECPVGGVASTPAPTPTPGGGLPTATPTTGIPMPTPSPAPSSDLTRIGNTFYLGGVPTYRFGLRAANALESDAVAQDLINNLDSIKSHGMQSVSISLQGGRTGTAEAYNSDGTLKAEFSLRISSVLNALSARNMVGVVSYFYQARDQDLVDDNAVRTAVTETTNFLIPWRNVWLYVINEPGHAGFNRTILITSSGQLEIYNLIKSIDSSRITHVSSAANDGFSVGTGTTASNGNVVVEYVRQDSYSDPGVFTTAQMDTAKINAEITFTNSGYWFWHAAWHQKADALGYPRFDKGGGGTSSSDRGVTFIWDKMRDLTFP